jgi:hypothetical protein
MNYKKIYDSLIFKRKVLHPLNTSFLYKENHHIIPYCMGGEDTDENKVFLTAREHFIAHLLLWKHYRTSSLAHALFSMVRKDKNQKREFNSRQYELARKAHSDILKETMKGEGNHFFGKRHTEESRKRIGEKNKNRIKTKEEIDNWVSKVSSKSKTLEHRKKIGRAGMIMLRNSITGENIRIKKEDKHLYNLDIWKHYMELVPLKDIECPHCHKIGKGISNMRRWHFDNCKQK